MHEATGGRGGLDENARDDGKVFKVGDVSKAKFAFQALIAI